MVTQKDACQDTDPTRWFRFLTSITNTSIADKVTRSKTLPHNLQQCFEKALEYEASFQLSEGVNMACKTTIMNVNVVVEDEVHLVKDARARSNACFKCGEMGHFNMIVNKMVINHPIIKHQDSYPQIYLIQW